MSIVKVFRCQTQITPATSITINTITIPRSNANGPMWIMQQVFSDSLTLSALKAHLYLQESSNVYVWLPSNQAWMRVTGNRMLRNGETISFQCPTTSPNIPYGCTDTTRPPVMISPDYRNTNADKIVEIVQCAVAGGTTGGIAGSRFGPWGTLIGIAVGILGSVGCESTHLYA